MDEESAEFYSRVRNAYLGIAKLEPDRFKIIDASGSVEHIHSEVMRVVERALDIA
jgi:dTMP kinase